MFKISLRIGLVRAITSRRSERRIRPSLEHLDIRIAPSGFSPVMSPTYQHAPLGSPTHNPFVVSAPPGQMHF